MKKPLLYRFIKEAEDKRVAIGHFNFSDIATSRGIMAAVENVSREYHLNLPVFLGTSEGESDYLGYHLAVSIKNQFKENGAQVFLNGDHIHSLEKLKAAVEAGYDSVVFDVSHLPFSENIELTREAVRLARSINPEFIMEGEVSHVGGTSKLLEDFPMDAELVPEALTSPEDAKTFADQTGVDLIAPAIGNIHGILKHMPNPRLDLARVRAIKKITSAPIVLHGGSGLRDEDFIQAIYAGVSVIHINTEIRLAWRRGLESSLNANPDEVAPYKLFSASEKAVQNIVFERLKLFNKLV
ncbi:MAG: class II fructose-bisphosphate aldolase [Parcubacteria group bacterium]